MNFEFSSNDAGVAISGELVFTDQAAFLDMTKRLFGVPGKSAIIDLSNLEFIDSAGLGMLLIARGEASSAGRELVLRGPKGQVKRAFAVKKFDSLFTIEA